MSSSNSSSSIGSGLSQSTKKLGEIYERLSSGKNKLNAADLSVVSSLSADDAVYSKADDNINIGQALNDTIGNVYSSAANTLDRLSELATQASNGTYSDQQRGAINDEYQSLSSELNREFSSDTFNGIKPGDSVSIQVGGSSSSNDQINISTDDPSSVINNVSSANLSSQSAAQNALSVLQDARTSIDSIQSNIGANSSRLDAAASNTQTSIEGTAAAKSRIDDFDIAQGTADLAAQNIRAQTSAQLFQVHAQLSTAIASKLLQ